MDSTYHVSATDLGHDNKQNNFFPCFPFSSFMLLWLLLKLLLDRQLWRKGGIAATCRWCCCLLFLLGFFSAGKKAEKLQHAWVWGQSTNGPPLSLLLRERRALPLFLAMETFGLFLVLHFLSQTRFRIFLLLTCSLFLFFVTRNEKVDQVWYFFFATAQVL